MDGFTLYLKSEIRMILGKHTKKVSPYLSSLNSHSHYHSSLSLLDCIYFVKLATWLAKTTAKEGRG